MPRICKAGRLSDRRRQVLAEAMAAAGLDRDQVFMTNAVKHFRFEARGKRRMHKNPSRRHIDACRHWLEQELALVRPKTGCRAGTIRADQPDRDSGYT